MHRDLCYVDRPEHGGEDPELPAKLFAHRFFGLDVDSVDVIGERYQAQHGAPFADPDLLGQQEARFMTKYWRALKTDWMQPPQRTSPCSFPFSLIEDGTEEQQLHQQLIQHPVVQAIGTALSEPKSLSDALQTVWNTLGRAAVPKAMETRVVAVLGTCNCALDHDTPLLRPTIHAFIQGLQGMAGTLDDGGDAPETKVELHPSEKFARERYPDAEDQTPKHPFPMLCCPSCGQHVMEAFVDDLVMEESQISGGQAHEGNVLWRRQPAEMPEHRLLLTDTFVIEEESEEENIEDRLDRRRHQVHVCSRCGSVHNSPQDHCSGCGVGSRLLPMWVLTNAGTQGGQTARILVCPSCKARGSDFASSRREPFRPIKAIAVADVHILAQEMLRASDEGHRQVIVFSDNRQDAAFQAGWMRDHARRYDFVK